MSQLPLTSLTDRQGSHTITHEVACVGKFICTSGIATQNRQIVSKRVLPDDDVHNQTIPNEPHHADNHVHHDDGDLNAGRQEPACLVKEAVVRMKD